jgi:hypothetical protein
MVKHQYWSKSNIELFSQCPRQWFLKYGRPKQKPINPHQSSRMSENDVCVRVARRVLYEWLEDHKNGSFWSDGFHRQQIRDITEFMYNAMKMECSELRMKSIINRVHGWMNALFQHSWFSKIRSNSTSWLFFPRTESVEKNGNIVYCAPDVLLYDHGVWTCLRIQFSRFRNNDTSQLECISMGIWALERPYMTEVCGNIRIRNLSLHHNSYWKGIEFECENETLERAQQLIEYDLGAMREVRNTVVRTRSLDVLPLARHPRICKTCPHLMSCPASNGLAEAKLEQKLLSLQRLRELKF